MVHFRLVVACLSKILMWGGIAAIAWVTFSCVEFCEESNRTAVVVHFYDKDDKPLTVKVEIISLENDSVLYPSPLYPQNTSQVLLPVNPSADFMTFSIRNDELPADTLMIRYTRHYGFISPECGCVAFAEIQGEPELKKNSISSIEVKNPNVNTVSYRQGVVNAENIRIYY